MMFFLISCNHDDLKVDPKSDYQTAIQLKIGNYWVYKSQSIVLNTNTIIQNLDDSTFIERDTVVKNKVYVVVTNLFGLFQLQRDSSGYIVDEKNKISFSSYNFLDTLYKNPPEYGLMEGEEETVEVPAGKFKTIAFIVLNKDNHGHHDHNHDDPTMYDKDHKYRVLAKTWYAKEVGVVKSVFYFGNSMAYEKKLKRYMVK